MPTYVLKIDTNSNIEMIEFPEDHDFRWYGRQIGCDWIEIVHPRGYNCVLVVDEEGRMKPNHINPIGSFMYGMSTHGEPIVGAILLMKEGLVHGEPDLIGLTEDEANKIKELLLEFKRG